MFRAMSTLVCLLLFCLAWEPLVGQGGSTSERSALAIRYEEGKSTDIRMDGSSLAPRLKGKAKVKADDGNASVEIEFDNLPPGDQSRSRICHLCSLGDYSRRSN